MTALQWRTDRTFVVADDDAEVWSFSAEGPVRLAGRGAGGLARAIDGRRSRDDVIEEATTSGLARSDAERILGKWLAKGHVVHAATEAADSHSAAPVVVVPAGAVTDREAAAFLAALRLAGVDCRLASQSVGAGEPRTALRLILLDDLLAVAETMADLGIDDGLAVVLRGSRAMVVGPLRRGQRGHCPRCLDFRARARRVPDLVAAERLDLRLPPPLPAGPATLPVVAAGLVAARLHSDPAATATVTVCEPEKCDVSSHTVVPVAGCGDCDPSGSTVVSSHLASDEVSVAADRLAAARAGGGNDDRDFDSRTGGGFRVVDPLVTWERCAPLISDVVGVVPHVTPTGPPELRAYSAGANPAAEGDLLRFTSRLRASSGGKGLSLAAARTGALAEALERQSLRAAGGEPHLRAVASDLPGPVVLPNDIQLFSERQLDYVERMAALGLLAAGMGEGFHRVPLRFDPTAQHDYSPVTRWRTGETVWLPSSLVWFNWPGLEPGAPTGCSNGAAAGNSVAEALLQGLLELVERDSVGMWWLTRSQRPAFDLDAWDDPRIASAMSAQHALGSEVWVLDVTSDIGIPAAAAVASGWTTHTRAPLLGFGAHLDPALAVVRALTELAQVQAPVVASQGAILAAPPGAPEAAWFAEVTVDAEPWLAAHGLVPPPPATDYASLGDALDDAVGRVESCGVEVLWADCTRRDIGLPVVRTWAPGLRHFWNRYAPGRLYDVPPSLGWCPPGYTEDDLNPRSMIL